MSLVFADVTGKLPNALKCPVCSQPVLVDGELQEGREVKLTPRKHPSELTDASVWMWHCDVCQRVFTHLEETALPVPDLVTYPL